jgi:uncharacterized membrane protein YdjX (TVP38/TMEM64 family)
MWTGFIAFLAAGLLGSYLLYKNDFLLVFIEWVQSHGAVGVIAFAFVYVIVSVLLLAPAELVSVAAGLVFGLWGVPLVIVSATIAAVLALLISRFLLRNKVERLIAHRPLFQAIDAAVADQSWRIAVLLRLNLLIPFNFQNYFFGITEIGIVPYTVTTFFGIMPLTAMYVYFGMFGHAVTVDQGSGWAKIAFLSLGLVPTVLIIYLVSRKARAELHQIARTK